LSASFGEILSLAAASDELLYAVGYNGDVFAITVHPPSVTVLGTIGTNFLSGLEYANGLLYAIDETTNALSTIQLFPVVQTTIGEIPIGSPAGPVLDVGGGDLAEAATAPGTCGRTRRRCTTRSTSARRW
jgi:hypothetical protein